MLSNMADVSHPLEFMFHDPIFQGYYNITNGALGSFFTL